MATGAKLNEDKEWLRDAIGEYIEEEMGHQEWILNDLAACGVDKEQARISQPAPANELMAAYAFDAIARKAHCIFGMVFVLEGTSRPPTRLQNKSKTSYLCLNQRLNTLPSRCATKSTLFSLKGYEQNY